MQGILGTNASFSADITLLIYIFVILPLMVAGYIFARRKMFMPHHKLIMTSIVVINWVLIGLVMAISYSAYVAPSLDKIGSDTNILLPTLHLITGSIAQLLATYLVLLMWTENTRFEGLVPVRIKNIKLPMRITLGLWGITIALGIIMYVMWYVPTGASVDDTVQPIATEEASINDDAQLLVTEEPDDDSVPDPQATEEAGS